MKVQTLLLLCLAPILSAPLAWADQGIVATPTVVVKGQTVKLEWYITGDKVVLSGGRFGKGVVVTGKTQVTDRPLHTTRYVLDDYYHVNNPPGSGKPAVQRLHTRYSVVVKVFTMPPLAVYRAGKDWTVDYVKGWQAYPIRTPDGVPHGLVFFQPEEDSIERLGVAMLSASNKTAETLMEDVEADIPQHYKNIKTISRDSITFCGEPAVRLVFEATDPAGRRIESIVLAFVHDGMGYVVSGRTSDAAFDVRRLLLDKLVESFRPGDQKTAYSETR
ncbi:MAG TPA: hypothetical protein VKV29_08015 [Chthonomonas sp.]|uniref:hypothetical protein n=1 Tax=Chthonomonas sp. TaxID=2282153 RepID=UPI002B4B1DFA|nr:hypothetical protein [Chthonomonas sp.]HLH80211.1 hypothetical protein [Chthonomonas sp.]